MRRDLGSQLILIASQRDPKLLPDKFLATLDCNMVALPRLGQIRTGNVHGYTHEDFGRGCNIGAGVGPASSAGRCWQGGAQFSVITDSALCPEPQRIINEFMPEFARLSVVTLMLPWGEST